STNAETAGLVSASLGASQAGAARPPVAAAGIKSARTLATPEILIFIAIVLRAGIFSFAFPDSFATSGTLLNMARVAGILLVVSIGQSFALIVGGFDSSVGATMGLVSVASALLMKHGLDVGAAAALGVLVGAAGGLINGIGI